MESDTPRKPTLQDNDSDPKNWANGKANGYRLSESPKECKSLGIKLGSCGAF